MLLNSFEKIKIQIGSHVQCMSQINIAEMLLPYWFGDNGRQSDVFKYVPIILKKKKCMLL